MAKIDFESLLWLKTVFQVGRPQASAADPRLVRKYFPSNFIQKTDNSLRYLFQNGFQTQTVGGGILLYKVFKGALTPSLVFRKSRSEGGEVRSNTTDTVARGKISSAPTYCMKAM